MITRKAYMDGTIDHETYHNAIADVLGRATIAALVRPLIEGLDASHLEYDPHLNRIALSQWDRLDGSIRSLVAAKSAEVMAMSWGGAPLTPGSYCWSLCETVCVSKAVAIRLLCERAVPAREA